MSRDVIHTALVVGVTGQDGSYLAELLLEKGYEVHGTKRRSASLNTERVDHLMTNPRFTLHYCDVLDVMRVSDVIANVQPDEIYNLAAQSHVGVSFEMPLYTAQATGIGTLNVLEAFRIHAPGARFYQASSSEMFGNVAAPQDEFTPMQPVSPYGCAKVFAHNAAKMYREAHQLHVSCGILFNHESPRRGETFVTRKITRGLSRIALGLQAELVLGNMSSVRDWGYAPEYVEAMWRMLQRDRPGDFVIGTGESATVADFATVCLELLGLDRTVIRSDRDRYGRANELHVLRAAPRHACQFLHWKAKTHWRELANIMVSADMKLAERELKWQKT